jgi:uncharacterized membrane protein
MSELLLAVYSTETTAEHVLPILRTRCQALKATLESAATVRVSSDCQFTVTSTGRPQSNTWFWGLFWGAFFGLVFRLPDPAPAPNSNLGQLFRTFERAGLDRRFRAHVRQQLHCGSSALGLFGLNWSTEPSINQLLLRPDACVRAWLSPELELLHELGVPPA